MEKHFLVHKNKIKSSIFKEKYYFKAKNQNKFNKLIILKCLMSQIQKRFKPKLINTKTLNQSFKNALIFKSPTLYVYTKYKRLILTK